MAMHPSITLDSILAAVADDYIGICVRCGQEQEGVEPDARKYECDSCGANAVYGAEELLLATGAIHKFMGDR
jgi:DNA-directed RNA polymerase subunit RPC12/RpoP